MEAGTVVTDRRWIVGEIRTSLWLQGMVLFLVCLVPLVVLIFATPGFVGNDDYYHARISAQIVEQQRLRLDFPWLPRTILSPDRFVDHHLLFHLYLAPWVYLGGMTGAKLATAGIAAGVFVAAWGVPAEPGGTLSGGVDGRAVRPLIAFFIPAADDPHAGSVSAAADRVTARPVSQTLPYSAPTGFCLRLAVRRVHPAAGLRRAVYGRAVDRRPQRGLASTGLQRDRCGLQAW